MSDTTTYKKGMVRSLKGLVIKVQFDEGTPDINEMCLCAAQRGITARLLEKLLPFLSIRVIWERFL